MNGKEVKGAMRNRRSMSLVLRSCGKCGQGVGKMWECVHEEQVKGARNCTETRCSLSMVLRSCGKCGEKMIKSENRGMCAWAAQRPPAPLLPAIPSSPQTKDSLHGLRTLYC